MCKNYFSNSQKTVYFGENSCEIDSQSFPLSLTRGVCKTKNMFAKNFLIQLLFAATILHNHQNIRGIEKEASKMCLTLHFAEKQELSEFFEELYGEDYDESDYDSSDDEEPEEPIKVEKKPEKKAIKIVALRSEALPWWKQKSKSFRCSEKMATKCATDLFAYKD